ncbi:MFS monocarboxylate transporter [Sanghuangporus baumii]|uniref:MFS monocarboxylate transporter n=1 Tax=Sanghuangporus baumii TaxID=108892 RepID=A0A9Q5I0M0_SANBA|nr:MFS monocarboxylate transporter [Sanghuangporus baumii]
MSKDEHDSLGEPKFELQVAQKEEPLEEPGTKPVQGPTFPDGGFRAWMTIVSCFLLSFTSYGQLNAYGVFQTYYIENQLADHSAADIAWIGNIQLGLMYLGGIVSGWAFDSYGSRSHDVVPGEKILSDYSFPRPWSGTRNSHSVVAGSSLSGVIFPIMLSKLFQSIGFPWTVRTLAFMCFALQGISIPFVKERFPPRAGVPLIDRSVYKDKPFLLHVISGFFIAFGLYTPFWYIELYALREKINANLAFYLISIMNAAGLLGRVSLGHVADRVAFIHSSETASLPLTSCLVGQI